MNTTATPPRDVDLYSNALFADGFEWCPTHAELIRALALECGHAGDVGAWICDRDAQPATATAPAKPAEFLLAFWVEGWRWRTKGAWQTRPRLVEIRDPSRYSAEELERLVRRELRPLVHTGVRSGLNQRVETRFKRRKGRR